MYIYGRIYDPTLGRFLQADPHIQAPNNSQNYNRYSYVLNNPMSYTDPSGYFFKKLFKAIGGNKFLSTIISIGLNFIPSCQAWCSAAFNAAVTYAVTGSLKGALIGAFVGAISPGGFSPGAFLARGVLGGLASAAQGGKFGHGFIAAGAGGAASGIGNVGLRIIASAVIGGTVSKITGGKFANGASSAAFATLVTAAANGDFKSSSKQTQNDNKPNFEEMSNEERVNWLRENHESLGIELAEGTTIEYSDEYAGIAGFVGLVKCETLECNGLSRVAGTFENGVITLYKGAFEGDLTYITESYDGGLQRIKINTIQDASAMGKAVFTFGHEAAHSRGIDTVYGDTYHTQGEAAGRAAYDRFRRMYE